MREWLQDETAWIPRKGLGRPPLVVFFRNPERGDGWRAAWLAEKNAWKGSIGLLKPSENPHSL